MNVSTGAGAASARKFVAPTSREALRLAREALGSEAMILANRVIADGIEIVAMAEDDTAAAVQAARPMAPDDAAAAQATSAPTAHADSVLSELHSMRSMIEEQLASVVWNDQQRRDPLRGRLLRTMLAAGFSARLSKAMLERLPPGQGYAQGMAFVKSELMRTLPVQDDEDALFAQGGVYALVGPTGVGKTTTTAKLAARCVMRFGADKLALVTTDSYRIGAYEQLRIYGQILNVPVYAVKDAANLQLVLRELGDKHMVLIDTVGMSQRDRAVSDQIAMLCGAGRPVKRLLLLNAASHGDTLNEVVYAYRQAGNGNELAGCIFTKLDEATSHGALLDTAIRHRLPVHYVSDGQKVPENLLAVDRCRLVDDALQARRPGALFVCEAGLQDPPAPGDDSAEVAKARAQADRLRLQYLQLISAMAHDAQEVAVAADTLREAGLGFDASHQLWRQLAHDDIGHEAVLQELMAQARTDIAAACDAQVLALCGRVRLDPNDHGDSCDLESSLLLSDRNGHPLAAPNQWLATDGGRKPGARQVQWLRGQDFGRPLVHLLPRLPAPAEPLLWQGQGQRWLARAPASTLVIDAHSGKASALSRLALEFGPEEPVTYRGRPALRADAQAQVLLRSDAAAGIPLRCVVTRIREAQSLRLLEQGFVLSNVGPDATARQLSQWQEWAAGADSCFRLAAKGIQRMGGIGALADPGTMKRLLVAGQVATTVWRLLHVSGERADRTRALLTELTGRQVRPGRPRSAIVLYEGLGKLFHLLDALGTEAAASTAATGRGCESTASRSLM